MSITLTDNQEEVSYNKFTLSKLLPFSISRILPFSTPFFITAILANYNIGDLAVFGYIMSMFMVVTTLLTMPLMITGNFAAKSNDTKEISSIFISGLFLSILLSSITTIVNLFFYDLIFKNSPLYNENLNIDIYIYIYLISSFLLGVNTFIFSFLEAKDRHKETAKAKTLSSSLSIFYIATAVYICNFEYLAVAFSSFLIVEVSTFLLLTRIAINYSSSIKRPLLSFNHRDISPIVIKNIITIGTPIAIGVTIQKIIFFLLNQRLASIDEGYVALLSIFGTVATLLLIPITSQTQANSLFISKYTTNKYNILNSIRTLFLVIISILTVGYITSSYTLEIFNVSNIKLITATDLLLTIALFVVANSLLAYTTSSLRGINDTLVPQVVINIMLIAIFIPVINTDYFNNASFDVVMNLQSLFIFICSLILFFRLCYKFKGKNYA